MKIRIRLTFLVVTTLAVARPVAAEQTGGTPRLELGVDMAAGVPDGGSDQPRIALGPRLTIRLAPRTAVALFGDVTSTRQRVALLADYWQDSRIVGVELRRALHESGAWSVSGIAGAGIGWHRIYSPEFTVGPFHTPAQLSTRAGAIGTLGVGLKQRLGDHLSVHEDIAVVLGDPVSELRALVGVNVPLGRYADLRSLRSLSIGSATFRTGQHLWITTVDGRETRGVLDVIDMGRIELRTGTGRVSIATTDIQQVRVSDSLRNGVRIGAIVGGGSLAGLLVFVAKALCEGDCEDFGPALALGSAYGVGVGAITGALVDSAFDRPVTVFTRGPSASAPFAVSPIADGQRLGASARLSW